MPPEPRRWTAALLAAAVTSAVAGAGLAVAAMTGQATATQVVSTGALAPPTAPAVGDGPCTVAVSASATVSWVPTESAWADGYEVLQALADGGPYTVVATVAGRQTTSATVLGLAFLTRHYYVVRATKGSWRSGPTAQVAHTTLSPLCA